MKKAVTPQSEVLRKFGERIYEERKKKGMTQQQLADCLYVSDDTIKRIERGKSVKLDVAYNISEVLNVPIQSLLPCQDVAREDELTEKVRAARDVLQMFLEILDNK